MKFTRVLYALAFAGACFAGPINVAFSGNGGVATQSSTYDSFSPAGNCNDGNADGNYFDGSVCHTTLDPNAWWQVTFNADYAISEIDVYNRTDCCDTRINPFDVFLLDSSNNDVWHSLLNTMPGSNLAIFTPPNVVGRTVKIQLDGSNDPYLHMAEVVVLGQSGAVPEPSAILLIASGIAALAYRRNRA